MKIKQILPQEDEFTEVLSTIALPPKMLFYRDFWTENSKLSAASIDFGISGRTSWPGKNPPAGVFSWQFTSSGNTKIYTRPKCVAIVGARKNTRYGEEVAYRLAYELAKQGVVIISGLAFGIDAIAHRGALDAGGLTVAILGSGVDKITPYSNFQLGKRILEGGGVIMSEYPRGMDAYASHFLERNRIISGLSDAVVVVEAGVRSGSLNTAMHAIEQGRELFAVPGDLTRPMSVGTNGLLRTGAHVCTCSDDVMGVICPKQMKQMRFEVMGANDLENNIIGCIKRGISDGEMIIEGLKISPGVFNAAVTMLEIRGIVRALGGNLWALR